MKHIKKLTVSIISSLMLVLVFGQLANAQEIIPIHREGQSLSSSGPEDSHEQFAGQALEILKADKGKSVYNFYSKDRTLLLEYCDKPDYDEKDYTFAYHFYDPVKQKNFLPGFMSASKITGMTKFKEHIMMAVNIYKTSPKDSIQELGRAIHYLEDINVPHHASNQIAGISSHMQYEKYISENNSKFFVTTSDAYDKFADESFEDFCTSIFDECATTAYSYKEVGKKYKEEEFDKAAYPTLKLAQENMAALFFRFYQEVNK